MCMCTYVYMCVLCVCVHTCTFVYVCVLCVCVHTYTYVCAYIHIRMCVRCVCVYVHVRMCTFMCVDVGVHVLWYMHVHTTQA